MLRANVDGDGHLDEVRDPDREGVITVEGGGSPWRTDLDDTLARLGFAGSENPDREARATLGDFDGDDYVDLALFWAGSTLGDDPVGDMPIHEVHFGPLSRDLTGENVGPLRIRHGSFVSEVRTGDQDGDGRPSSGGSSTRVMACTNTSSATDTMTASPWLVRPMIRTSRTAIRAGATSRPAPTSRRTREQTPSSG